MQYILSINIGQINIKACVLDQEAAIVGVEQESIAYHHPFFGHIEQDPEIIYRSILSVINKVLDRNQIARSTIKGIGIAGEKRTTVLWNKKTGKALWNAILTTDSRSEEIYTQALCKKDIIKDKTGMNLTPFESATKIRWILDKTEITDTSDLCFGNLCTWAIWKLSCGKIFATDSTQASSTLLYNIHTKSWDPDLLKTFSIDEAILPEVKSNCEVYGNIDRSVLGEEIPICSLIGSAQAALFASGSTKENSCHALLGSSSTISIHIGEDLVLKENLATTIALDRKGYKTSYCIESSIYSVGSIVNWLETHLGIIKSPKEIEGLANSVPDSGGVYFVPTMTGISYPEHNSYMKGALFGISENTNIGHISRGLLEGIGFLFSDHLEIINKSLESPITEIKCSGGASENILLLELISGLSDIVFCESKTADLSSLGAGYLAGIAAGVFKEDHDFKALFELGRKVDFKIPEEDRSFMIKVWKKALESVRLFSKKI